MGAVKHPEFPVIALGLNNPEFPVTTLGLNNPEFPVTNLGLNNPEFPVTSLDLHLILDQGRTAPSREISSSGNFRLSHHLCHGNPNGKPGNSWKSGPQAPPWSQGKFGSFSSEMV